MVVIEENKPIISKMILKKSKVEDKMKVKIETLKVKINFRWESNIYRYDIINDFKWISANIFFKDLMKIK